VLTLVRGRKLMFGLLAIDDPELREELVASFDEARRMASAGEITFVVLAARRLACVYQALLELGMEPLPCSVVSDRTLDLDDDGTLKDHKVLIIDDCVIVEEVARRTGSRNLVATIAVCADKDRVDMRLVNSLNVQVRAYRNTAHTQAFSLGLARLLFHNLVPYFTDFPATTKVPLAPTDYAAILNMPGWASTETTAERLRRPGLTAYSLVPRPAVAKRIAARLGGSLWSVIALLKVRLLVSCDGQEDSIVAVPLAILRALPMEVVNDLLTKITEEFRKRGPTGIAWETWNDDAKYRLLQMFVSTVLLQEFWRDLGAKTAVQRYSPRLIDPMLVQLHFGPRRSAAIVSALQHASRYEASTALQPPIDLPVHKPSSIAEEDTNLLHLRHEAAKFLALLPAVDMPARGNVTRTGATLVLPLAQLFGYIGELEEAERARLRLALTGNDRFRWLNEGITLGWLAGTMPDSQAAKLIVSYALDTLNDLGIAVPTTVVENNTVYRRYRIGENVYLASEILSRGTRSRRSWLTDRSTWLVSHFTTRNDRLDHPVIPEWPEKDSELVDHLKTLLRERNMFARAHTTK
jgi:hypothetical protein